MPFGIAAAGITAAAGIGGAIMQSNATKSGQKQAEQQFQQQRADLAPYRQAGLPTLQAQNDLLGLNGQDAATSAMGNFQKSPGYQFQLDQGLRAVDAGAAAQGILRSGATLKAEQTFGQGLANQDFTNYYNRLMGLTTLGANAAAGGAQTAQGAANAAQIGGQQQASIYGNTATGLSNATNKLFGDPSLVNTLFPGGTQAYGNNTNFLNSSSVGSPFTPSIYGVASPY